MVVVLYDNHLSLGPGNNFTIDIFHYTSLVALFQQACLSNFSIAKSQDNGIINGISKDVN